MRIGTSLRELLRGKTFTELATLRPCTTSSTTVNNIYLIDGLQVNQQPSPTSLIPSGGSETSSSSALPARSAHSWLIWEKDLPTQKYDQSLLWETNRVTAHRSAFSVLLLLHLHLLSLPVKRFLLSWIKWKVWKRSTVDGSIISRRLTLCTQMMGRQSFWGKCLKQKLSADH